MRKLNTTNWALEYLESRDHSRRLWNGYVVVESAKVQGQSFGNLGCDAGKEVATLITFESK